MKNETMKRMLLPIGLLLVTGISFIEHFIQLRVSDFAQVFVQVIGIAIMLLGLVFIQGCRETNSNNL